MSARRDAISPPANPSCSSITPTTSSLSSSKLGCERASLFPLQRPQLSDQSAHGVMASSSLPPITLITLGATALQAYDAEAGGMRLKLPPRLLLDQALAAMPPGSSAASRAQPAVAGSSDDQAAGQSSPGLEAELVELPFRSGAELTSATLCAVRDAALRALGRGRAPLLLLGTDTLEEAAFLLWLLLGEALLRRGCPLVVTGAMLPADQLGGDGAKNMRDALLVATDPSARQLCPGQVLVVMNDSAHLAQNVRKADSQLIGAFRSPPGPLGQLRGGRPLWYYRPLPPNGPDWLPCREFEAVAAEALAAKRVAVWVLTVDGMAPPEALLAQLDGLVLAGSGSGSLPAAVVDALSPAWTSRLPIVVSSRCSFGANHDDFLYQGSLAKYEDKGFVVAGRGYERLNALQARCLLAVRLAALGHA